ncbi:hypothetical protein A2U01_0117831, partial [Trifolium medium]|nr:hypothetical protein [Trifolium medium]
KQGVSEKNKEDEPGTVAVEKIEEKQDNKEENKVGSHDANNSKEDAAFAKDGTAAHVDRIEEEQNKAV